MIVTGNQGPAPRLSLSQIMAIERSKGSPAAPRIKGWLQATTRRLPDCPRCGTRVRFDEPRQDYVCDACGLGEGIDKGPIVKQVAQNNLITRELWPTLLYESYGAGYYLSSMRVFLSNDDTGVHELKGIIEQSANGTVNSGYISWALNTTLEYGTFTYTFTAPASPRTVRQVGLYKGNANFQSSASAANWKLQIVQSVTELTSEIVQGTSDTFEVVYKYQFSEVTP